MAFWWRVLSVLLALEVAAQAATLRRLEKVELTGTGTDAALAITTDAPANWTSFKLADPTRIVLDFPETEAATQSHDIAGDVVTNWSIAPLGDAHSPTARLTLTLGADADYTVRSHGRTVTLQLRPPTGRPLVALATGDAKPIEADAVTPKKAEGDRTSRVEEQRALARAEAKRKSDEEAAAKKKAEEEAARVAAQKKAEAEAARVAEEAKTREAAQLAADERAKEKAARLAAERAREETARQRAKERTDRIAAEKRAQEAERAERLAAKKRAAAAAAKQRADERAERLAAKERAAKAAAKKRAEARAERLAAKERAEKAAAKKRADERAAKLAEKQRADERAAQRAAKKRADERAAQRAAKQRADERAAQLAAKKRETREAARRVSMHQRAAPSRTVATLKELGFRRTTNGARVVVRTSSPVRFSLKMPSPRSCVLELEGAHIRLANDRRPLDTHYFGTAVARVVPHKSANEVTIALELSEPASCVTDASGDAVNVDVVAHGSP